MYSNSDGRFSHSSCGTYVDQYWYLEVTHSSNQNYYRIKNKESGECVFLDSDERFGVYDCDTYDDQYWTFEAKSGDPNYFRIKNYQSRYMLYFQYIYNLL